MNIKHTFLFILQIIHHGDGVDYIYCWTSASLIIGGQKVVHAFSSLQGIFKDVFHPWNFEWPYFSQILIFFSNSNGHGCTWRSSTTSLYSLDTMNHQWINVRPLIHFMYGHQHVYPNVMNLVSINLLLEDWIFQGYGHCKGMNPNDYYCTHLSSISNYVTHLQVQSFFSSIHNLWHNIIMLMIIVCFNVNKQNLLIVVIHGVALAIPSWIIYLSWLLNFHSGF